MSNFSALYRMGIGWSLVDWSSGRCWLKVTQQVTWCTFWTVPHTECQTLSFLGICSSWLAVVSVGVTVGMPWHLLSFLLYICISCFHFFLFSFLFLWDIINLKIHTINNSIITFSQTKYERMFCSSSPKVLCPWSRWRFILPLSYAWFCLGNIFQRVQVNFPWVYQQWLGLLNCW